MNEVTNIMRSAHEIQLSCIAALKIARDLMRGAVELKAESMRMKINADEHFATCGGVIEERNGETYLRIGK